MKKGAWEKARRNVEKRVILWDWLHDGAGDDGTGGRKDREERGGEVNGYGYLEKAARGGRRGLLNL